MKSVTNSCFSNFSYKYQFRCSEERDLKITMILYCFMLQTSARWNPFAACRPLIDEAPVFYPTFEVLVNYHYHSILASVVVILYFESILFSYSSFRSLKTHLVT